MALPVAPPAPALPVAPPAPAPVPAARAPSPRPSAEPVAAPVVAEPVAAPSSPLGDRWTTLARKLADDGAIVALTRELAWQAGLVGIDETTVPPRWRLCVEREALRQPALRDKLAAALAAELGAPVELLLEPGTPEDSPLRRDAAERSRRQAEAEETIRTDPVVRELLGQFKTARIVPGSIKPI
jgi:DNA polymerase-3 subunit gamma/tau